ncbi:hypothetical protein CsSME_00033755 [Camellia sinensis var. sinensis]
MAQVVVSFVAKWIGELMIQEAKLLYRVCDQVDDLLVELRQMQCFLKDADTKQIRDLVAESREIAYDAEDVIATFVFEVEPRRRRGFRNFITRSTRIFNELITRRKIGCEIKRIRSKITGLTATLPTYELIAMTPEREGSSSALQRQFQFRRTYSHVKDEDFIGFEQDIKILVAQLVSEEAKHRRVVSICGMPGLGKTILARKVYHHQDVRCHFDAFAWVSISQQWQLKDVLQRILTKLIPEKSGEIVNMIDDQLVKLLYEFQQPRKRLLVLDDIWSSDVWESLVYGEQIFRQARTPFFRAPFMSDHLRANNSELPGGVWPEKPSDDQVSTHLRIERERERERDVRVSAHGGRRHAYIPSAPHIYSQSSPDTWLRYPICQHKTC